jgi:hypothetical protein
VSLKKKQRLRKFRVKTVDDVVNHLVLKDRHLFFL